MRTPKRRQIPPPGTAAVIENGVRITSFSEWFLVQGTDPLRFENGWLDVSKRLCRVEQQRHRPVVERLDGHVGAKPSGLDVDMVRADAIAEMIEQHPCWLGLHRRPEARPVTPPQVAIQCKLRDREKGAMPIEQAAIHLVLLVSKEASVRYLVGEPGGVALCVRLADADQRANAASDLAH